MSKFFLQFLLSAMIGVSAAAGFNSNGRGELKEMVQETKSLVRETTQAAFETVNDLLARTGVMVDASVDISAEGEADSSVSAAQLTSAGDLNLTVLPGLNADSSFAADSNVNVDAATDDVELNLSEELQSTLGLDLDAGN